MYGLAKDVLVAFTLPTHSATRSIVDALSLHNAVAHKTEAHAYKLVARS